MTIFLQKNLLILIFYKYFSCLNLYCNLTRMRNLTFSFEQIIC